MKDIWIIAVYANLKWVRFIHTNNDVVCLIISIYKILTLWQADTHGNTYIHPNVGHRVIYNSLDGLRHIVTLWKWVWLLIYLPKILKHWRHRVFTSVDLMFHCKEINNLTKWRTNIKFQRNIYNNTKYNRK